MINLYLLNPEDTVLLRVGSSLQFSGKTFSVLNFAKKNYKHVVYLNFFENPDYASVFSGSLEVNTIVMMLFRPVRQRSRV